MKLRHLVILLGSVLGAGAGLGYWYAKHCSEGTCLMDFSTVLDLSYWALLGCFFSYFLTQRMARRNA